MKRIVLTAFAVLAALIQLSAQEQTAELYFEAKDLPDGVAWLPAPPDTIGALFAHDIMQYMWGKSIRDTERGRQAVSLPVCIPVQRSWPTWLPHARSCSA